MALTIEDGSVVPGADSFATVAEFRAYATKRGESVPAADADCEVLLIKAMDYLQGLSESLRGQIVEFGQPLVFPRFDVETDGYDLPSDEIPADIKNAQIVLAIEAQNNDLLPTVAAGGQQGAIVREKVDVLETQYAEPVNPRATASFAKVDALLTKYLVGGSSGAVPVVRV